MIQLLFIAILIAIGMSFGIWAVVGVIIALLAIRWVVFPILGLLLLGIEELVDEIKEIMNKK